MPSYKNARMWLPAALLGMLPVSACTDTPPQETLTPEITIELLSVSDNAAEFTITAVNSEYFTWSISGSGMTGRETKVEDSYLKSSADGLQSGSEYTIKATAWNGSLSTESSKTFTTSATPSVTFGDVTPTHDGVSFILKTANATAIWYAVTAKGTKPADSDWTMTEKVEPEMTLTQDGLSPETDYTISAYGTSGDIIGNTVTHDFTTAMEPSANRYITVTAAAAAKGVCIDVTCGNMEGRKYYCNIFDPAQNVYYGYQVNSEESFLQYVKDEDYSIKYNDLCSGETRFLWCDYTADGSEIMPDKDYLIYAITYVENGDSYTFDEDGIIEISIRTESKDVIGSGNSKIDFTVTPGSDIATVEFSISSDVSACSYGYVSAEEAEASGGIEDYVKSEFENGDLRFTKMLYFYSETNLRPLVPDTKYIYYTLSYGRDGKLGPVHAKEFNTEALQFSDEYTCTLHLDEVTATTADISITFTGSCFQGRCCNITADEFSSIYDNDVNKVAMSRLTSNRADQIFDSRPRYLYDLEPDTEYVFIAVPMGGDMSDIYGTPAKLEYTTQPE